MSERGARDLLPAACRRRRELVGALVSTFERWGYEQVATPLVESFEMLGRGLSDADRDRCVRFIEAGSAELVALRSDVTPQIARMLSRRLGGELAADLVYRWCYAADVVRQPLGDRDATEHHQVGVELVGDADTAADVELVALCDETLRGLGLAHHRIDLAHGRIANALVEQLALAPAAVAAVHGKLARKDKSGVIRVLAEHHVTGARAERLATLCDLYGPPDLLARADAEIGGDAALSGLAELRAAVAGLARAGHDDILSRVTVDLGEIRGFDYYTGLRMRVWAPGVAQPIVRGGRYDHLFGRYGAARPATGFAIDLDALEAALGEAGLQSAPVRARAHVIALAPAATDPEARARAAELAAAARHTGARAWVHTSAARSADAEVGDASDPGRARARAEAAAQAGGAAELTWIEPDGRGGLRVERSTRTAEGWRTIPTASPTREASAARATSPARKNGDEA